MGFDLEIDEAGHWMHGKRDAVLSIKGGLLTCMKQGQKKKGQGLILLCLAPDVVIYSRI